MRMQHGVALVHVRHCGRISKRRSARLGFSRSRIVQRQTTVPRRPAVDVAAVTVSARGLLILRYFIRYHYQTRDNRAARNTT